MVNILLNNARNENGVSGHINKMWCPVTFGKIVIGVSGQSVVLFVVALAIKMFLIVFSTIIAVPSSGYIRKALNTSSSTGEIERKPALKPPRTGGLSSSAVRGQTASVNVRNVHG